VVYDAAASAQITRWAYEQADAAGAQLWLRRKEVMVAVDGSWRAVLSTAGATL
jgi:hypothetical protein